MGFLLFFFLSFSQLIIASENLNYTTFFYNFYFTMVIIDNFLIMIIINFLNDHYVRIDKYFISPNQIQLFGKSSN